MACESVRKSQGIPSFKSEPRLRDFKDKLRCDIKLLTEIPKIESDACFSVHLDTSKGEDLEILAKAVNEKFQEINKEGQFAILVGKIEHNYHTVGYFSSVGSETLYEPYEKWTLFAYVLKKS
jgi:hypothetical protein